MTEDDVKNRRRFLNIRNTLNKLLEMNIVPIINENDTVVVKEIKFGDNDTLSAYVTNLIEANLLIILSDIDGFYDNLSDDKPVEIISSITKDVFRKAGGSSTEHGTGGMFTKIKAADMILKSGEMMVIAKAGLENIIYRIVKGEAVGTIFVNETNYLSSRKRWLAFNMKTSGRIYVDKGAEAALLEKKKSLLPIGITLVEGSFKQGDGVDICSQAGSVIARGIINYANDELQKIIGRKSKDIEEILGKKYYDEVVHRDNMVVNITGD